MIKYRQFHNLIFSINFYIISECAMNKQLINKYYLYHLQKTCNNPVN